MWFLCAFMVLFCTQLTGCSNSSPTAPGDNAPVSVVGTFLTPFSTIERMEPMEYSYSSGADCPWGFMHQGLDFYPSGSQAPFQAVASGAVLNVELRLYQGEWLVEVSVDVGAGTETEYFFETFSADQALGQAQLDAVSVRTGDTVSAGERIGTLLVGGDGSHVHFGINLSGEAPCPDRYFTDDALAAVRSLLEPGLQLCY